MPIQVILRKHVDNLGRRGEIVKVASGYARNYLLPQKIALPLTEASKRQIDREREIAEVREAEARQAAEVFAAKLAKVDCIIERKVGETETLYGSVTVADVADQLASQGAPVEKRRILLPEPLKQLGEFVVPVRLHADVTAEVTVKVIKAQEENET